MKNYRYKERRNRMIRQISLWAGAVIGSVLLAFVLVHYCFEAIPVHGESMEPSYHNGSLVLVNKLAYRVGSPGRLDPVMIELSNGSSSHYSLKRVIGLPGEKILIEDGKLLINGEEIEGIFTEEILSPGLAAYEVKLEENEYFVMGDNCNNSEDSRAGNIGNIKREEFAGKVVMTIRDGE